MPFDGAFLYCMSNELMEALDCHIDKIYQPSKEELVFLLRKKGFVKRLLINIKSGGARVQFTENKFENPEKPPMFCMLMRKHLLNGRLMRISQPDLERVIIFSFSSRFGKRQISCWGIWDFSSFPLSPASSIMWT